ncbi:hypothetical protein CUJ91_00185 [Paraburkholderia graminis]|uniref:hypothetical protein n=1 Tax=Paraburkholderia graminis TaxID=60548 RepID=UPI000DEEBCD3|nr:hypothetical protein [Paraburkholderia graminis]AXF06494.1 hypothetical protein CUJ91_00185 [Paraburkholderia graminis]
MKVSIEHNLSPDKKKVKRKRLSMKVINEINAVNRRIAETWTPEMDAEIELATLQYRLARCATLTEEKLVRAQKRAQLKRDLKKAVTVKLLSNALDVDALLARIRSALADVELHELNAMAELRAIRAELRQA